MLVSDVGQLPAFTWLTVDAPRNRLEDVVQSPPYPSVSGADGSKNITNAWGGAAWDHVNQRMLISGGGHGDSHPCETGIYALDAGTLQFQRLVDRQPLAEYQHYVNGRFVDTEPVAYPPYNQPLKNGVPSSWHTYDGMVWVPPEVAGNRTGGLVMMGAARAMVDLDNGKYSTCHWFAPPREQDWPYQIAMLDGRLVFGPRASSKYYRFDLGQTEATSWSPQSFGRLLGDATSGVIVNNSGKAFCWLRERREHVSFTGDQRAVRVRYGQAIDAGTTDWTAFHDVIQLESSDGSHLDFNAKNLLDDDTNLLCAAGTHHDAAAGCIWIQGNPAGSGLYKVTGLDGSRWTVSRISGATALTTSINGTYGRLKVAVFGNQRLALRVSGTEAPVEVMRLA